MGKPVNARRGRGYIRRVEEFQGVSYEPGPLAGSLNLPSPRFPRYFFLSSLTSLFLIQLRSTIILFDFLLMPCTASVPRLDFRQTTMDLAPPSKPSLKQACDNCRKRKIKCSRELPCDKCQRLLLSCSYSDVLRRKGPKFRTLYPLAPIHPLSNRNDTAREQLYADKDHKHHIRFNSPASPAYGDLDTRYGTQDISDTLSHLPPPDLVSSPDSTNSSVDSASGQALPHARRLSPQILLAHVNVYLKYLFPIMPVVRGDQLRLDSQHPERLSPRKYAFLASLCAATHIQLKLDGANPIPDSARLQNMGDGHSLVSGEKLLSEAVRARQECDPVEDINIETLLTSFFLFASYGNLDKQSHAWFYLCQATSMAFTLGLHRESTYAELKPEDAEERRRVFWLLFITER